MMPQPNRVLIVDDEPDFLETVSYWLTSRGYEATIARTGEEALQQIARRRPDVILLDIVMPRMNGLETLKRIRTARVATPVVLLTTAGQDPDALIEFQALGIAGLFQKQAPLTAFGPVLESALRSGAPVSS